MTKLIDNWLNGITMYRLVLYYLILLFCTALYAGFENLIVLDPYALMFSLSLLLAVSWITNRIFARTYGVPANVESIYISALILTLIIPPLKTLDDLWFTIWAGILSMASKYIVTYKGKHLFNPVAFAVAVTYFTTNQSADWWVGNTVMLPVVILGGLLVVRKIGRSDLVLSFLISSFFFTLFSVLFSGAELFQTLQNVILYSPLFFFAFIILTEPLTMPPTRGLRIIYGALVGFLFTPQLHLGALFITPELAILIGNLYSFTVSPKFRMKLVLKEKTRVTPDTYEFTFYSPRTFKFRPGQYMEWTLGHHDPDSRGNRRYFTLASSPSENVIRLGVKFAENSSSFKQNLLALPVGGEITASQLEGDFVLPSNTRQKCVLIAGGIGVTPFRSMIKHLLDLQQRRPITLLYAVKSPKDIVYKDIFDRAERELGIKTVYSINDTNGLSERIDENFIRQSVPNYQISLFYISGSRKMVDDFKSMLQRLGIPKAQIKTDFFAGLA